MYTEFDDPDVGAQDKVPGATADSNDRKVALTIGGGLIAFVFMASYVASNWEALWHMLYQ